ncbi:MAG: hypothetical protein WGN25_06755 [Candidatus Electrothrix sp. GW3-4]|uniref:hypothetical protein n=1 Tax=Candidatus Electrothrix sp. GW3-4 TaxID=3126740 RepID=UPI0030CB88E2
MKTKTRFTCTAIAFFFSTCFPHLSAAANYPNPIYQGYSLDWCKSFEHECGKPAADAFCKKQGHLSALDFSKKSNMQVETMTIQDHAICNPQHHRCDSFTFINCKEKLAVFHKPEYRGYRLDWCKSFEHECGKPAADAFCQHKGFSHAQSFVQDVGVNVSTMTLANNAVCNPAHHHCDSFKVIRCQ